MRALALSLAILTTLAACADRSQPVLKPAAAAMQAPAVSPTPAGATTMADAKSGKVARTDEEWRRILTPEQYRVMREKGTERAFTGKYWETTTPGIYKCAACGEPLFASDAKFDSGCGWPSFFQPLDGAKLVETEDRSWGVRTEITCAKCGAHMGHVFDDGPKPTGLRYCINSVSIELVPEAGTSSVEHEGKPAK